jgi:hypothetical protein
LTAISLRHLNLKPFYAFDSEFDQNSDSTSCRSNDDLNI